MSSARIHPAAIVGPDVRLADDVTVGPYAVLDGDVRLGPGCAVGPHTHLIGPLVLGADNVVHTGAVLGDRPQHLNFRGPTAGVVIGGANVFRENVTVHASTTDEPTRVGDRNYLMAGSHVAHDCRVGDRCVLANGALLAGHCTVGDGAFLSGNTAVHQFARVGRLALLSGGATSSKDMPPFCMLEGRNQLVGVNVVGLKRAGVSAAAIDAVREAYRLIFASQQVMSVSLELVERKLGHVAEVAELLAFVRTSKRGVPLSTVRTRHAA